MQLQLFVMRDWSPIDWGLVDVEQREIARTGVNTIKFIKMRAIVLEIYRAWRTKLSVKSWQGIDIGQRGLVITLCFLWGWLGTLFLAQAQPNLPDLSHSAAQSLSTAAQQALSQAFIRQVRAQLPVLEDPLIDDYLSSIVQSLRIANGPEAISYHVFLIEQPVINAFAGPGGHIGLFAGLILATETESELAAVIAHEMAHIQQQHLLRTLEQHQQSVWSTTLLMAAAVLLGAQVDANLGAAAITGIQALSLQRQLNFSRDHELEADRLGIDRLAQSGYDPYAMPGFFRSLEQRNRLHSQSQPELLRTHPVTSQRIADALARAEAAGHHQKVDRLEFHLLRARLRVRSARHAEQACSDFEATLTNGRYRHQQAEQYGYVLALQRAGRLKQARQLLTELLTARPQQPEWVVLAAELDCALGRCLAAREALQQALIGRAHYWPFVYQLAVTELALGQPGRAVQLLEQVRNQHEKKPVAFYQLLADATGLAQQQTASLLYRAEQFYAEGDITMAIEQLEQGLQRARKENDFHVTARMQSYLEQWRLEQQALEQQLKSGID
jgi:predicted Zn-dependent protease